METKLKETAQEILLSIEYTNLDVDGYDQDVKEADGKFSFNMVKYHDEKIPGKQGPGSSRPIGKVTYTVTVEAKYEPFDGES